MHAQSFIFLTSASEVDRKPLGRQLVGGPLQFLITLASGEYLLCGIDDGTVCRGESLSFLCAVLGGDPRKQNAVIRRQPGTICLQERCQIDGRGRISPGGVDDDWLGFRLRRHGSHRQGVVGRVGDGGFGNGHRGRTCTAHGSGSKGQGRQHSGFCYCVPAFENIGTLTDGDCRGAARVCKAFINARRAPSRWGWHTMILCPIPPFASKNHPVHNHIPSRAAD